MTRVWRGSRGCAFVCMIGLLFGLLAAVVARVGKVWESWVGKLGIGLTQGGR